MDPILIPAKERSPRVDFRFDEHQLSLSGESYPEDAAGFYGPVVMALVEYCQVVPEAEIVFTISLTYFNTSSAKVLMNILHLLEQHGQAGAKVHLIWNHHPDDEMMMEFGADFSRDLQHVKFTLHELET
jgi:hypothetical protein